MQITYSLVDASDNYVGHAEYNGSTDTTTFFKAVTAPVRTLAGAQAALDALVASIALRFPHWVRDMATEPGLVADEWRGNPVRAVIYFSARSES